MHRPGNRSLLPRSCALGAVCATIGAALMAIGGTMFVAGAFAYSVFAWYATAPEALSAQSGTALLVYADEHRSHFLGPQLVGFLMLNVGLILIAVALWRAASVPRWLPVLVAGVTVAQFVTPPNRALDLVQAAHMASLIAVAWFVRASVSLRDAPGTLTASDVHRDGGHHEHRT